MSIHSINGARHEIRPDPATVQSATGEPTSILEAPPAAYPLAAVCANTQCRGPIRLASWSYLARWAHATPDQLAAEGALAAVEAIRSGAWDLYLGGLAHEINARKRKRELPDAPPEPRRPT